MTATAQLPPQMVPITSLLWTAGSAEDRPAKQRVLVIDDNSATCELLSLLLGQKGLEVATARTSGEGKVLVERGHFDLMILDWKLDGTEGLDLLRLSKTRHPDLPVIIFTGADADGSLFKSGLAREADAIVRKMGPLDTLCKAVFGHLGRQQVERFNAA
jgi:DNA-binding response OmpR family regulator